MHYLFVVITFLTSSLYFSSTTITSEKICVNCKYFVRNPFCKDTFGKCSAFPKKDDNELYYLISGKRKIEYYFCVSAREDNKLCGPEGKMYMKKYNFFVDFFADNFGFINQDIK
jgi:hypothetical protein